MARDAKTDEAANVVCCSGGWNPPQSVTATDISFAASDNSINSEGEDLSVFPAGVWLRGSGSVHNDGLHFVADSGPRKLVVDRSQTAIVEESSGARVTLGHDGFIRNRRPDGRFDFLPDDPN